MRHFGHEWQVVPTVRRCVLPASPVVIQTRDGGVEPDLSILGWLAQIAARIRPRRNSRTGFCFVAISIFSIVVRSIFPFVVERGYCVVAVRITATNV